MKTLVWVCLEDDIPVCTETIDFDLRKPWNHYSDNDLAKMAILEDVLGKGGSLFRHKRGRDNKPSYVYAIDIREYDHSICFDDNNRIRYVWYMIENNEEED